MTDPRSSYNKKPAKCGMDTTTVDTIYKVNNR